jgi:hypothetical protein
MSICLPINVVLVMLGFALAVDLLLQLNMKLAHFSLFVRDLSICRWHR